jgi:hypothetical protein
MPKRKSASAHRPKQPISNSAHGNRLAWWRRLSRGPIQDQVIAGVLIAVIVAAGTVVWKNVFGDNSEDRRTVATSQPSSSSSEGGTSQSALRAEVIPFDVIHFTPPSPTVVLPLPLEKIPRPPSTAGEGSQKFLVWARNLGGADAESTGVSFVLRSDMTAPVIVANVRVVVQQRSPAMRGTWLDTGQAGDLYNRVLEVDLDRDPPIVERISEGDSGWNFPLKVSVQDPELFTVIASADESLCVWTLEVDYVVDGKRHTLTIDNDGQPFRTTGIKNVTAKHRVPRTDADPWP